MRYSFQPAQSPAESTAGHKLGCRRLRRLRRFCSYLRCDMECREDLKSILPFLPFILRSSSLFWPSKALDSLKALALGPDLSHVNSGEILFDAIIDIRDSLGLSHERLAPNAVDGYSLFFDELMSRADSRFWFSEVVPKLASLLLRLPSLLEAHYRESDVNFGKGKAGLRLMDQQDAGIVFLSQELVAALLACALFCLFPTSNRTRKFLPTINFDHLFASVHPHCNQSQEYKIKCLIHYFERICQSMPKGLVSFERKLLTLSQGGNVVSYPDAAFWKESTIPLCSFEAFTSGSIEDQQHEALEVDFANEYLGGGALHLGCVQEEIRFMINPELIVGMLFMVSMQKNEAIEVIGSERFSNYTGYGSSFRFVGDCVDKKPFDATNRRKTRIIAIDALQCPGKWQYGIDCILREINKAYCGFFDQSKYKSYKKNFQDASPHKKGLSQDEALTIASNDHNDSSDASTQTRDPVASSEGPSASKLSIASETSPEDIGIATGNWGCGAFGGDPEIKCVIQWLAASQALRPFMHYYTFGTTELQKLDEVSHWILSHGWTVGDLWSILIEYSTQRINRETNVGFFSWLLPLNEALHHMSE
ncbi:poly(ADP-ribose) glycohydrolase 1 [Dendrobium catenatum]|uniref:poly(ADP-ribose) glycohydrolase 1 n=1 Tax=Dendrobium catenatum TaxID=906689 RepID=UPI00109FFAAD|nr:poly(ADP-ribose) glycohydrolase 1 [Dendrobium catenatum]